MPLPMVPQLLTSTTTIVMSNHSRCLDHVFPVEARRDGSTRREGGVNSYQPN